MEKGGINWRIRATVPKLQPGLVLALQGGEKRGEERQDSRGILQLASTDTVLSLLLGHVQQVEITPVVEGTRTIPGQDKEHGGTGDRYEDQRQQDNELGDLSERKGRIDGAGGRGAESLGWVPRLRVDNSGCCDELLLTLIDQHSIKDIHQGLIHEECLEEGGHDGGSFTED